jgi:hypothetical protein
VNHWRLKLLGGSGKARKSETDAAEVVSLGRVCASETLNKDRQSGENKRKIPLENDRSARCNIDNHGA